MSSLLNVPPIIKVTQGFVGGMSLQGSILCFKDGVRSITARVGPPHVTAREKFSSWWGFEIENTTFSLYDWADDNSCAIHVGGRDLAAMWCALLVLRVPQPIAWRPANISPHLRWEAIVNAPVPFWSEERTDRTPSTRRSVS